MTCFDLTLNGNCENFSLIMPTILKGLGMVAHHRPWDYKARFSYADIWNERACFEATNYCVWKDIVMRQTWRLTKVAKALTHCKCSHCVSLKKNLLCHVILGIQL